MEMNKKLHRVLIEALVIGILLLIGAWYMQYCNNPYDFFTTSTQDWWKNILINMGAGLLTAVALIYFYDMVLLQYSEKERTIKRRIAYDSLLRILDDHYKHVIWGMFRSACVKEQAVLSIEFLTSDEYFNEIEYLDLNKSPYLAKDDDKQNIVEDYDSVPRNYQIILDYNKRLSDLLLHEVLVVYGQFLEADICEIMHQFRFSPFVIYSHYLPQVVKFFRQPVIRTLNAVANKSSSMARNGLSIEESKDLIDAWKQHNELFVKLVEYYNQSASIYKRKAFDIIEASKQVKVNWGVCRLEFDEIAEGKHSLKNYTNKDIDQVILDKVGKMEEQLQLVYDKINKREEILIGE
jgi:hypothetical protein